ncbi:MAG: GspE/PulE family protein [Syntrophales bacterium]|jgi:type II secretory ATPase GspE/PulE/Tfp pilus assembly ATPase PilB-like protein|nr:GspE/PulE family protein [Syntrophales bacterium]
MMKEANGISHDDRDSEASKSAAAMRTVVFNREMRVPEDLLINLSYDYLRRELWVPLRGQEGRVLVAVCDPANILKKDMIQHLLRAKSVEYCLADREDILRFIDYFYGVEPLPDSAAGEGTDSAGMTADIIKLVDDLIEEAYERRASDIHIEPDVKDRQVNIRLRIDGECIPYKTFPYNYRAPIVSRVKIMSNLDITEKRLPQDGKIMYRRHGGEELELRVATMPTYGYTEDVVLRILTRGKIMSLEELSMPAATCERVRELITKPYGLILLVGPTGSGKTTTAHAVLQVLNKPNVKIWTVEDPVEITQRGIRQVQVHHKIGLDFSSAMRSFLRSDPDIIMVGEMRDYETAKMGVEASTTGHLVLSTLHTNNAPETIVRLLEIGIDPFAFSDSLLCVLAQRLVRALCPFCREAYHPVAEEYEELSRYGGKKIFQDLNIVYDDRFILYRPKGCGECNGTGYRGRMGLFELLVATDTIKQMIISRKSIAAIRKIAMSEGMQTLLQCGVEKILRGETDLMEVLSVCIR